MQNCTEDCSASIIRCSGERADSEAGPDRHADSGREGGFPIHGGPSPSKATHDIACNTLPCSSAQMGLLVPVRFRQSASRGPPRPGFRTPAALPPVDGFPALRVLRRLRRPRGAAGDPTFPWCWTSRARRRCPVRPLEWGHSPSSTTWKVQATTTLPPYRGGPDVRRLSLSRFSKTVSL